MRDDPDIYWLGHYQGQFAYLYIMHGLDPESVKDHSDKDHSDKASL